MNDLPSGYPLIANIMGTAYGGESRMSLLIINFPHHPLTPIMKRQVIGLNETQTPQKYYISINNFFIEI